MIERIQRLDDPRLDDYRSLKDAPLRRDHGIFIAEGRLLVRTLLTHSLYRPRSIAVTDSAYESLRDLLDDFGGEAAADRPAVYLLDQSLMNEVAGFNIHRGCLAAVERGPPTDPQRLIGSLGAGPCTVVVLEDLLNHDNVGGIFRNAAAFGASAVLLSPLCVDPLYRKAVRVSMGGALRVPWASFGAEQWPGGALAMLREAGFLIAALAPRADAMPIDALAARLGAPARVALLLGAEGPGLSAAALEAAHFTVTIPISPTVDSLNVATASGIALHRVAQRSYSGPHHA